MTTSFQFIRCFFNGLALGIALWLMYVAAAFIGLYELFAGQRCGDYERMKI